MVQMQWLLFTGEEQGGEEGNIPVRIWACRQPEGLVKIQPEPYNKNSKYLKKLHIKVYKNIIQEEKENAHSVILLLVFITRKPHN